MFCTIYIQYHIINLVRISTRVAPRKLRNQQLLARLKKRTFAKEQKRLKKDKIGTNAIVDESDDSNIDSNLDFDISNDSDNEDANTNESYNSNNDSSCSFSRSCNKARNRGQDKGPKRAKTYLIDDPQS